MCPNSIYFGFKVLPIYIYMYVGANVYSIWVHGPTGCSIVTGILDKKQGSQRNVPKLCEGRNCVSYLPVFNIYSPETENDVAP